MSFINKGLRLGVAVIAAGIIGSSAFAADVTIRISQLNKDDPFASSMGAMVAVFQSLVESASNGEIEVLDFPNGQLGKDNEVIQQVRDGIIQSTISSSGGMAQHYPLVGVFDVPFAFPNIAVASQVIRPESDFGQKFLGDLEDKTGLKVLGMIDASGFFAITNSKGPIETLEDMQGLRIRTMTLPTHEAIISSIGGQPTALPWAEVYTALQTGVVDGQMNPIPVITIANFGEVQDYLSITNHLITPFIWTMNQSFYDGLSAEHRAIVDWAADVASEAGRGMARVIEASDRGLPSLGESMQVNVVAPEEMAKFAAAAQPAVTALIAEKFGDEGTAMLDALLANIEAVK
ncbi:MAG: DctP family TRAP transporter solute-binding subunit [Paracoccaceae bacterium]|nr:DctP family TRAP transporter solute-binding subunit [Paracoccaceae bacterium]MDG1738616.1 DctP family TRAP transporter solute-binding subunit [Paracoccaceae bacterium]MDG2257620.1 DctP family TRAP transporter solute-binding subunit [Paracoccaceae bacterium]